jgi:hypothetical protein
MLNFSYNSLSEETTYPTVSSFKVLTSATALCFIVCLHRLGQNLAFNVDNMDGRSRNTVNSLG